MVEFFGRWRIFSAHRVDVNRLVRVLFGMSLGLAAACGESSSDGSSGTGGSGGTAGSAPGGTGAVAAGSGGTGMGGGAGTPASGGTLATGGTTAGGGSGNGGDDGTGGDGVGGDDAGSGGSAPAGGRGGVSGSSSGGRSGGGNAGNAGTGGGGECIVVIGDMRTCFLDKRTKLTAARTCTPGAPNQCGDTIMDECGCAIAVNDADSAEARCFLRSIEEQPCGYCIERCLPPAGECELSSPDLVVCR